MKTNFKMVRRIISGTLSAVLLSASLSPAAVIPDSGSVSAAADDGVYVNFAEALQLSMYFYDANRCGDGITGGWLEWRGDCHVEDEFTPLQPLDPDTNFGTNLSAEWIETYGKYLDPDGTGYINLTGGWHDAGDHVKFGLPGAYAAATVGWGYYEFPEVFEKTGQKEHAEDILRWINDYYMKVTYLDENGDLVAYCYQVGEGNIDHNYWNAPELQNTSLLDFARPAYFATDEAPAVDQCCNAAASLAIHYLNFKDSDPEYAQEALDKALALYNFALKHYDPDDTVMGGKAGYDGGFYTSSSCYDEYAWAAVWLYICTGDYEYINQIISVSDVVKENGARDYTGYLKRIIADTGNCWQNIWVHCWDTVWGGVFAKLAPITNNARDWYIFRWNLEYWSGIEHQYVGDVTQLWNQDYVPNNDTEAGAFLAKTPEGFSMLNNYGSCRYDTAAQLCAVVYAKYAPDDDPQRFARWARDEMIYIMGDNPMGYSYIVGYSDAYASHPHHRASHGSLTLNMDDPVDQTHILWGALVGGPDADDFHKDFTSDYIYNEVAVDYNAGFVGACAGLYYYFGEDKSIVDSSEPRADFPPKEENVVEFYVSGKIEQENAERTQLSAQICGNTSIPPRYIDNYKIRYFFNITEMLSAGQSIDDLSVQVFYDQNDASYEGPVHISDPIQWDTAGTYYVEIDWNGYPVFGMREIHFGLIAGADSAYKTHWDPTDDYSRTGLTEEYQKTEYICMYVGDELVYGKEPAKQQGGGPITDKNAVISAYSLHNSLDGEMADICPTVRLENTGNAALDLSTAKIRYWFTVDSATDLQYCFDYAHLGEDNLTGKFVKLDTESKSANAYFEIGFTSACGVLGAGSNTGDIQFRIIDGGYQPFEQANDYSYNGKEDFTLNPSVTVYSNGKLIYGNPPVDTGETFMYGDVLIDGEILLTDLIYLAQHIAGMTTLSYESQRNADVQYDGTINIIDLVKLARYLAKIIPASALGVKS